MNLKEWVESVLPPCGEPMTGDQERDELMRLGREVAKHASLSSLTALLSGRQKTYQTVELIQRLRKRMLRAGMELPEFTLPEGYTEDDLIVERIMES